MPEAAVESHPTTERYRRAAEAGDPDGVVATLAEDVVLFSPITEQVVFRGREEVRELLRSVFATLGDIRYHADVGDQRTRALFDRARLNGRTLEQATRLSLNERDEITEITIFFRPLPGLAALTAALGPRVAASRHGRARGTVATVLLKPLELLTALGDRFVGFFS